MAGIPKMYQELCQHHSLAEDFNIDQMIKSNKRFFFEIFINIDTRPDIQGGIHLTNLDIHSVGIFLPVRVTGFSLCAMGTYDQMDSSNQKFL